MIWVGKNLGEQGVISCIYYACDIGKVHGAIALLYAVAVIHCMSLAVEKPHQALDA